VVILKNLDNMMQEIEAEVARPRGSLEFVETSVLDTIIPSASSLNIEQALSGSVERLDDGSASPLASIPQRQTLFFGKSLGSSSKIFVLLIHRS
jgi:hypothetical protein